MARYKTIDTSLRFIALDLERQLLPGTFEHALNHLLDHEMDLSALDARYCNEQPLLTQRPYTRLQPHRLPESDLPGHLQRESIRELFGRAQRRCCTKQAMAKIASSNAPTKALTNIEALRGANTKPAAASSKPKIQ